MNPVDVALFVACLLAAYGLGWLCQSWRAEVLADRAEREAHYPTENGNMFGGYDCSCGKPWLDATRGCTATPRKEAGRGD